MNRFRLISVLVVVAVIAVAGVALGCGGNENGDSDGRSGPDTTQATTPVGQDARAERRGESGGGAGSDRGSEGPAPNEAQDEARRRSQEQAASSELTGDEKAAQVNAQRFYDILGQEKGDRNTTDFDSAGFCELMSEESREQTVEYARRSSGIDQEWNCENSVELLVIRAKRTGGFRHTRKAKIVGVNAEGDRATATVRFGKAPLTSIPLVKEDGEWKLGASVTEGESGGD